MVAVLIVGAAAAGLLLTGSPATTSSSTSNTAASTSQSTATGPQPFKINYNSLTVGYNGGLWTLGFQDVGGKKVQRLMVVLETPVRTIMCTGFNGGLQFANCISVGKTIQPSDSPSAPFAANANFTGFTAGAGPGSAKVGQSYPLTIVATFADGTAQNQTSIVLATSSG